MTSWPGFLAELARSSGVGRRLGAGCFGWKHVPAAAFLLGTMLIPESPRFLIFRGKHERAREIFARIGADAEKLVREVEQSLKGEHRPRLSDLIIPGTRRIAPVLWVGMGLAAFQQFVGINIIFYYGEILWKAAGATEQWALRINLLTGLVNILATIPAIMLVDRIGRKPSRRSTRHDPLSAFATDARTAFDVQKVRRDFPILSEQVHGKPLVYLDSANTSQKPQAGPRRDGRLLPPRQREHPSRDAPAERARDRALRRCAREGGGVHQRAGSRKRSS